MEFPDLLSRALNDTADLMDRFYADLRGGSSKAQALRTAALAVRRQFANPAFWAAFELIGEP